MQSVLSLVVGSVTANWTPSRRTIWIGERNGTSAVHSRHTWCRRENVHTVRGRRHCVQRWGTLWQASADCVSLRAVVDDVPTLQSLEATSSIMGNKIQNSSGASTQPCLVPLAMSNDADTVSTITWLRVTSFQRVSVAFELPMAPWTWSSQPDRYRRSAKSSTATCIIIWSFFIDLSKAFNSVSRSSPSRTVCGTRSSTEVICRHHLKLPRFRPIKKCSQNDCLVDCRFGI